MVDIRPGLMAFPSGDLMRRSATPFSSVTMADGRTRTTPASTIAESVLPQDMLSMQRAMQRRQLAQAAQLAAQKQQTLTQVPGGPAPLSAPKTRGALAAAMAGLQYAGPQMQPTSFAQGLGVMGTAAIDAYDRAMEAKSQREMAERDYRMKEAMFGLKQAEAMQPDRTTLQQNLIAAGYTPGTPEFEAEMAKQLAKPTGTSVSVGAGETEFAKQSVQQGFKMVGEADQAIAQIRDLEPRLEQITKILSGGGDVETGRIASMTFPFRQILAEANLLSEDAARDMSNEELLRASIQYIIPRMRVVGSGSTSDKEMNAFSQAAPNFANSTLGNQKIASGMTQIINYQKERRNLMDDYMQDENLGNGTLLGFNRWADEKQGDIFKTYTDDESFDNAVESKELQLGDMFFNGEEFLILDKTHIEGIK